MRPIHVTGLVTLLSRVKCSNVPFGNVELTDADTVDFPATSPRNSSKLGTVYDVPDCRAYPGTAEWPHDGEWARLNSSLGGVLLKPVPPAAVCYDGPYKDEEQCNFLLRNSSTSRFYINDPLTVLTAWGEGDTCYATLESEGLNCTQGGFPVYVVNATSVKHIQLAVNFARNENIRLAIKNTGHDFIGRSVGFGSLSIWTHWLKGFEFLPHYSIGGYNGMAARVGSGLESWELHAYMAQYNMTVVVASAYTVGAYGGWIAGGGHSPLASTYGLGSDQVLSLDVVTADGRFVTADVNQNTDLFYAMRGGGGSTYGVVTSAVVKAYPPIQLLMSTLTFSVNTSRPSGLNDTTTFWRGFDLYHEFGKTIVDSGGTAYSNARASGNNTSISFTTNIEMPNMPASELSHFVQPLYVALSSIGISVTNPTPVQASNWLDVRHGVGDAPSSSRFASRLLPRANFEDPAVFGATQLAIREAVEAGYTFHAIHMAPTEAVAGYPGDNAVNPAFRTAIMHFDLYESTRLRGATSQEVREGHARFNVYMDRLRAVSPGGGAYVNECDVEEPGWQRAFFGGNYERLLGVKRKWDPWGVFYAVGTVGSEEWEVVGGEDGGIPMQNGPLCRVGRTERGL